MKIEVPQDINDITVGEYIKFNEINNEDTDDEFLIHKTINIFCGVDMRDVMNMDYKDAELVAGDIFHALSRDCKFSERFTLNGIEYGFITSLEGLTLGEYIDLETYLKDQKDLHKAAAVMYRPITKQHRDLYEIENYNSSIKNQELMKQAPVGVISQAVVFFLQYRERIVNGFPNLFGAGGSDIEDYSAEAQFSAKHGWLNSIYALADGYVGNFDTVTNMNLLTSLTWLEYEKEKIEIENRK